MAKLSVREKNERMMTRISTRLHNIRNELIMFRNEPEKVAALTEEKKKLVEKYESISDACDGDAHSNPHIDNCGLCAPFWGRRPKSGKVSS